MPDSKNRSKKSTDTSLPVEFEDALKRLEEVVEKLEGETVSLEDSLALFEEGIRLADHCRKKLAAVELRMHELVEEAGGEIRLKPLE